MSLDITIRNSVEDDFQAVKRYFLDNLSDYNVARSDDVLLERIGQRKFVIICTAPGFLDTSLSCGGPD